MCFVCWLQDPDGHPSEQTPRWEPTTASAKKYLPFLAWLTIPGGLVTAPLEALGSANVSSSWSIPLPLFLVSQSILRAEKLMAVTLLESSASLVGRMLCEHCHCDRLVTLVPLPLFETENDSDPGGTVCAQASNRKWRVLDRAWLSFLNVPPRTLSTKGSFCSCQSADL